MCCRQGKCDVGSDGDRGKRGGNRFFVDYHGLLAESIERGFARRAIIRNVYAFLRIVEEIVRIVVSGEDKTMVRGDPPDSVAFGGLPNNGWVRFLHTGGCPKNDGDAVINIRTAQNIQRRAGEIRNKVFFAENGLHGGGDNGCEAAVSFGAAGVTGEGFVRIATDARVPAFARQITARQIRIDEGINGYRILPIL